ncbi:two pore calcium channel protein 1 [Physcomitrium patens]|uniref:Putative two-pore calcium channel n=1 Tax=Physcomitrium patens TaxID=3218 RepID=Q05KM6_PHYPA|nr:two pore calcium channel protein 1-like [Physcomitrium patens]XP_024390305.1 two pore calcium channel protein 1-like [Physcomitrium patens]PNR61843.1 hypothetical protein PHYPA_000267 [Physcomitrium patens]BAF34917.1 putative two-pore calcium channel [Physcomitrium patens]|eukprot:XP_024390296.1 two pore calcium channel protein 1-like [Physcomitrella patens]
MEDPLLPTGSGLRRRGESSSSGGFESTGLNNVIVGRRGDAITRGDKYQKAAAMVDQAEDGVGLPPEVLEQSNFEEAAKYYFAYISLDFLWELNLAALLLLNFFEVPLWCKESFPTPCGDREKFFLGGLPYLTRHQSLITEVVVLLILGVHTFFPIAFTGNKLFWRNNLNLLRVSFFLVLALDTVVNAIYIIPTGFIFSLPFRLAPYLRVAVVILNTRGLRNCVKTLAGIIPDFADIAALLGLYLLFSSWLAYVMFEDTVQGKTTFTSYSTTLYQMAILFTTSNSPDVWLDAYKSSRFYSLFFILYILIGVYFFMNLVLAVVYDSFKGQLAKLLLNEANERQQVLGAAFNLLDEQKRGFLDKLQCARLFKELNKYRSLPKIADDDMEAVFCALDDSGDFRIDRVEFNDLCNAISLKFDKADEPSWFEYYPAFYNSAALNAIKAFVRSQTFDKIVIGFLLINAVAVIIETTLDIEESSSQALWQDVEFALGWVYVIEVGLKVLVYGFTNYWRSAQNQYDFIITVIIVVSETVAFFTPGDLPFFTNDELIRYLLIARLLRLTRLLVLVERYKVMVATFFKLIPNLMPYLGIVFCLMCLFCSLGVHLFGGLVYAGNPILETTSMFESDYLLQNFNDFSSGMVTLFDLLIMGSWQTWMDSYVVLTGTWWTMFYFWGFYVIAVLFLLNLIAAFVLEAFFAEMEMAASTKSSDEDGSSSDSDNEADRFNPRRRAKRARDFNVQSLLNHMLSAEMEKNKS